MAFGALGAVWGSLQAVLAELQRDYGFDDSRLGLLLLLPPLCGVPAALSGSRIVARFGSRRLIVAGAVVLSSGLVLLAFGDGGATPWIGFVVLGIGSGLVDIAVLTAASIVQATSGRPVMGRVQAIFFVGVMAGSGISLAVVALGLSYRVSFAIVAALLLTACLVAARALRLPAVATPESGHLSPRRVLTIGGVPLLVALAFGGFFLEGATTGFSAVLLRNAIGSSAPAASAAAFVVTIGLAIGAYATDTLSARISTRRTMALGATVAAVGVAAAATAGAPATAIAAFGIAAFGFGGIGPAALTLTVPIDQRHGGGVLSTVTAVSYVAFLFGPVVVGQLAQVFGLRAAFGVVAAAAALLAVVSLVGLRARAPAPA